MGEQTYIKQKLVWRFEIRHDRLDDEFELRDRARIEQSCTRFVQRWAARNDWLLSPSRVSVVNGTYERPGLIVSARGFAHPDPRHRETLAKLMGIVETTPPEG